MTVEDMKLCNIEICNQIKAIVDDVVSKFQELQRIGGAFLKSFADKMDVEADFDYEDQIRVFMVRPIEEIFEYDESESAESIVFNGLYDEDIIRWMIEENLLRDSYYKLIDLGIEDIWAIFALYKLLRKLVLPILKSETKR